MNIYLGTVWVCFDCLYCSEYGEYGERRADLPEPLALIGPRESLTSGMGWEDHAEDCEQFVRRGEARAEYECECETRAFVTSACDGCGDFHHGERHAATLWVESRPTTSARVRTYLRRAADSRADGRRADAAGLQARARVLVADLLAEKR